MRGYYREVVTEDGAVTVEPTELMAWARSMERDSHRWQLKDELPGDVSVSTVFLGLDHSFGAGDPILYETMVFGGPLSDEQGRYHTRAEAIEGHAAMVKRAKEASHTLSGPEQEATSRPMRAKWAHHPCRWEENSDGNWETACEQTHVLNDGTPVENKMRFCCYCGKPLREIRHGD